DSRSAYLELALEDCGRAQLADRDAVPVAQGRPHEMIKRSTFGLAQHAKTNDQHPHHDLGCTRPTVVALHRDAETALRQRAQVDTLGANVDEGTRAEPLHDLSTKTAGAGDVPGMRRAGDPQPRRRLGALGPKAIARAEPRKAEREMLERHRPGRHRATVDG